MAENFPQKVIESNIPQIEISNEESKQENFTQSAPRSTYKQKLQPASEYFFNELSTEEVHTVAKQLKHIL